jgi:hypothetical protein
MSEVRKQGPGEVRTIKINGSGFQAHGGSASASDIQEPLETPDGVMIKGGSVSRRRRTYRRQEGGSSEITESEPAPKSSIGVPIINVTKIMRGSGLQNSASKTNIPPPPALESTTPTITQSVIQQGAGASDTKVILKPKTRTAKVLLKKKTGGSASGSVIPQSGGAKPGSSKKTRRLIVTHVSKRLKKTRHVVKKAKEMPIADLKKILITKKLIKSSSKAPESILRQIYADSLIVGKKTL